MYQGEDKTTAKKRRKTMAPNPKQKTMMIPQQRTAKLRPLKSYIPAYLRKYIVPYHGDFCYTTVFHPRLMAQLMSEGFLPIASEGGAYYVLLPKLHQQRCVIHLPNNLHISRSTRKKAKRFQFTVNQAFDDVVTGCRQQHGRQCWLYAPLVQAFRHIQQADDGLEIAILRPNGQATGRKCLVRLYSIEIWNNETNTLAGGELGYTVGSIYTSLTGFAAEDSAGSVQLAALGKLLCQQGFTVWDLGMEMEYKRNMGSELLSRDDFVATVHRVREQNVQLPVSSERKSAKSIIDDNRLPPTQDEESPSAAKKARRSNKLRDNL